MVEHGVALISLVELGHDSWRREILDSGAARQPEVLRSIVEALQRPSIVWLGLGLRLRLRLGLGLGGLG